jgi:hypothetical protein
MKAGSLSFARISLLEKSLPDGHCLTIGSTPGEVIVAVGLHSVHR